MTISERILAFLAAHQGGATDREIFDALDVTHYQQVNSRCRELANRGVIERRQDGAAIRNFYRGSPVHPTRGNSLIPSRPWFWEGNIQAHVVRYLVEKGWNITRVADTASREGGKDVVASKEGNEVWVTVKGRPQGTDRTNPATQARHWFQGAIFDLVCYRDESKHADLIMAVPEFPTYRNLEKRITWLAATTPFSIAWVGEDGSVSVESYDGGEILKQKAR